MSIKILISTIIKLRGEEIGGANYVILNSTHFFIMKITNKRELQETALNHSSDIDFKDFLNIHKKCTKDSYSFLVNDTALPSDNPLRFRKNLRIILG